MLWKLFLHVESKILPESNNDHPFIPWLHKLLGIPPNDKSIFFYKEHENHPHWSLKVINIHFWRFWLLNWLVNLNDLFHNRRLELAKCKFSPTNTGIYQIHIGKDAIFTNSRFEKFTGYPSKMSQWHSRSEVTSKDYWWR